jgi:tRNA(fMet)-specific endonuclease VapC
MRRYLLDSNHLEMVVRKDPRVSAKLIEIRLAGSIPGTATPIAGEFIGGLSHGGVGPAKFRKAYELLESIRKWPYHYEAAEEYARLYAELRRKGITIGPIDLQAAAVARSLGNCTVVTCDSDFSQVPGLTVENWMASEPNA